MFQLPLDFVSSKTRNSLWISWPVMYQPRSDVIRSSATARQYTAAVTTPGWSESRQAISSTSTVAATTSMARVRPPPAPLLSRIAPAMEARTTTPHNTTTIWSLPPSDGRRMAAGPRPAMASPECERDEEGIRGKQHR